MIINYDLPSSTKDYIQRVGRTARAGKFGHSLAILAQYDIETFQKIEANLGIKMEELEDFNSKNALTLMDSVIEAQRLAHLVSSILYFH